MDGRLQVRNVLILFLTMRSKICYRWYIGWEELRPDDISARGAGGSIDLHSDCRRPGHTGAALDDRRSRDEHDRRDKSRPPVASPAWPRRRPATATSTCRMTSRNQTRPPSRPMSRGLRSYAPNVTSRTACSNGSAISPTSRKARARPSPHGSAARAQGYGALKVWQAEHGVLNGSVAHARKRCVAAIVAALNATGAAKVSIPNAGRFRQACPQGRLAACRTGVFGAGWRAAGDFGELRRPSRLDRLQFAVERSERGRFGSLLCGLGRLGVGQAGARTNIRLRFHAMVTRLHSARTLSRPRNENWRNPSADLMMPNTGSGVCLRKA